MVSDIPKNLCSGPVRLVFEKIVTPEKEGELVPFYHFKILDENGTVAGHINLRIGNTRHVNMCAGHIGYEINEKSRGHCYSYYACLALVPFVRKHYNKIILTSDPENKPSLHIIEKLNARFIEQIDVPSDDPAYVGGARKKKRFEWVP